MWRRVPCGPLLSHPKRALWRSLRIIRPANSTRPSILQCSARQATTSSATSGSVIGPTITTTTTSSEDSFPNDAFVSRFSAQLLSSPHLDITHVPYGDWFTLYVQARKHWHSLQSATIPVSSAACEQHAKRSIDALLLSSLFARHWTEVQTATTTASSSRSTYRWWWHRDSFLSAAVPAPSNQDGETVLPLLELCTPAFLTEPLLGGNHLRLWMEDTRASPGTTDVGCTALDPAALPTAVLPFSSLWVIKQSAYWRPSTAGGTDVNGSRGVNNNAQATAVFSLQERQARQALLQSVDQLLQLQRDAADSHKGMLGLSAHQLQRVCVLSPTQEWDLLCSLPRYRQALCRTADVASSPNTNAPDHSTAAHVSPPRWLSLNCLCEDTTARLAYCAHTLNWQRQLKSSANTPRSSTSSISVRVLSPSSEHARLRSFSLPSLHEQSCVKASLQRRHAARPLSSSSATSAAFSAATVHEQARKGCSDAVRRMSHREENILQSFFTR
ncbi:hypothetical protein JKF63_02182 [Porcisia hertigi]|uniref:Uncharacterized protein n=1 Tax=Porcisia hertigi TaxID=2761500 RepID=A0A836HP37_9TRYP|nr:hypothetical protein JKF63_02182 [Porcisia hertigi]